MNLVKVGLISAAMLAGACGAAWAAPSSGLSREAVAPQASQGTAIEQAHWRHRRHYRYRYYYYPRYYSYYPRYTYRPHRYYYGSPWGYRRSGIYFGFRF